MIEYLKLVALSIVVIALALASFSLWDVMMPKLWKALERFGDKTWPQIDRWWKSGKHRSGGRRSFL